MRLRLSVLAAAAALAVTAIPARAQVSVGGVVYAQATYNTASDTAKADTNNAGKALGHLNTFDVTRAYLNVTGRFGGGIATRVTADIFNNGGSRTFRLKYAYVNYTPEGSHLTYRFGQLHTPWVDYEEALWDYRMQGTTVFDRNGYLSSSDFGAAIEGSFSGDRLNFLGGVYNGENYNGGPADGGKDLMARASLRLVNTDDPSRVGGLRVTGYAQYGTPTSGGQRQRYVGMVSYRTMNLTLAGMIGATTDSTTGQPVAPGQAAVTARPQAKGSVMSAFGVFHFPATRFAVIGRVDVVDPNTASGATGDKQTRIIAGASYQLTPNVRLLADLDRLSYESGFTATAGNYAAYLARSTANLHLQFTF